MNRSDRFRLARNCVASPVQQERDRGELCERCELLHPVERRDPPRREEDGHGERGAHRGVDPEEVVPLLRGEHRGLHRSLGEAEVAEDLGDAGDRHDHGEEPDVGRRQQSRHDDHRRELDEDAEALPRTGDGRPANRAPAESSAFGGPFAHRPARAARDRGSDVEEPSSRMPSPTVWNIRAAPVYCGTVRARGVAVPPETGTLPPGARVPTMKGGHQPPWRAARAAVDRRPGGGLCDLGARASGARRRDQPGGAAERVHRLRALHASRHLARAGARRRRLPQAAPHPRRGCRRRRGCTQLRAVLSRMSRGRRSPAEESPAPDDGFLLRRVGGVGERRGGAASRQQRRGPDRPARLAPRERAGEHDRLRVGRVGCPTHGPGDDHDEGGCARGCGFALRAGGGPLESRRGVERCDHRQAVRDLGDQGARDIRSNAGCRGADPPLVLLRRHPVAARDRRTPRHARSAGRRSPRRSLVPRSGMARPIHRSRVRTAMRR